MLLYIRKYLVSEKGSIAPMAAMLFMTMAGFVALGVDVSQWMMQKRALQTAADAGALAGAYELANGQNNTAAEAAALKEAKKNGYDPTAASASFTPTIDPNGNGTGIATVKVDVQAQAQGWFTKLLGAQTAITKAEATAAESVAGSSQYCMLTLGTSGTDITISGHVTVDATSCGLAINSNDAAALSMNGNTTVNVGALSIAGGYSGGRNFSYTSLKENTGKQTADPYASYTPPDPPYTCALNEVSGPHTSSVDGVTATVYCGGYTPSQGTPLDGLVYVVNGDFGDNGGTVTTTSNGASIILTNSNGGTTGNSTFHGNGSLTLTAPTTGPTAGIAIWQNPNAPSGCNNQITGTPTINISGVVYAPNCQWEEGGNASSDASGLCTEIIAKTIFFHGTPNIGTSCASSGAKGIGVTYKVQLIE